MKNLSVFLIFSWISYTTQTLACLPEPVPEGTPPLTIEEAQEKIAELYTGVETKYLFMCKCASQTYGVRLPSDSSFKEIEVGGDRFMGSRLLNFVTDLLKIPDDRVLALSKASQALEEDMKELSEEFGLIVYDPDGAQLSHRFPGKQRLYVGLPYYELPWSASSCGMRRDVLVNTSRFIPVRTTHDEDGSIQVIPGRTQYDDGTIYRKGELRETFLKSPAFHDLRARAIRNFNNRECQHSVRMYPVRDWGELASRFIEADPSYEAKADLVQEPFLPPPGKDIRDAIMNFFAQKIDLGLGNFYADPGRFDPERLSAFLPEIPKELEPWQDKFLIALVGLGFFNYHQGHPNEHNEGGVFKFAEYKSGIEDYAKLFAIDPEMMNRIPFGVRNLEKHRWDGSVPTIVEFLQIMQQAHENFAAGTSWETMREIRPGSARDLDRDAREQLAAEKRIAEAKAIAEQADEAKALEVAAEELVAQEETSLLPNGNEVHQAILNFYEGAAENQDWEAAGAALGPFNVQEYSQFLPKIPASLQTSQSQFGQVLNALGFFNYRQGEHGVFKFVDYKNHIENYARFFARYPEIMANVDPNSGNVRKYRLNGDVALVWQLCEDLGLDHKQYPC